MVFSCAANTIDVVLRNEKDIAQCKQFFFFANKKGKESSKRHAVWALAGLNLFSLGFSLPAPASPEMSTQVWFSRKPKRLQEVIILNLIRTRFLKA